MMTPEHLVACAQMIGLSSRPDRRDQLADWIAANIKDLLDLGLATVSRYDETMVVVDYHVLEAHLELDTAAIIYLKRGRFSQSAWLLVESGCPVPVPVDITDEELEDDA